MNNCVCVWLWEGGDRGEGALLGFVFLVPFDGLVSHPVFSGQALCRESSALSKKGSSMINWIFKGSSDRAMIWCRVRMVSPRVLSKEPLKV